MKYPSLTFLLATAAMSGCIDDVPFTATDSANADTSAVADVSQSSDTLAVSDVAAAVPNVIATPASIDFGVVPLAQERQIQLTLTNTGTVDAVITNITLTAPEATDIWLLRNSDGLALTPETNPFALPRTLAPGADLAIIVVHEDLDRLAATASIAVDIAGGAAPLVIPLATHARVDADLCRAQIIGSANVGFGRPRIAPWGDAYIAGAEGPQGTAFRLAEVDLDNPAINPVIPVASNDFAMMQGDWIAVEGDTVSVYEFYPTGQQYTFNRLTRATTSAVPEQTPVATPATMRRAGVTWSVRVGSGPDDICRNVCLMRTPDGGQPEVFLDDAATSYRLHTNHVFWHGDHVYFMSYNNETPNGWTGIYRRVNLASGLDEPIVTLDPTASNAWVEIPKVSAEGWLYWIRRAHDGQNGRAAEHAIDRFDPTRGVLTSNLVADLGAGARDLQLVDGFVAWIDDAGIRTASRGGGTPFTLLANPGPADDPVRALYLEAAGGALWYTRTVGDNEATFATFGCLIPRANEP